LQKKVVIKFLGIRMLLIKSSWAVATKKTQQSSRQQFRYLIGDVLRRVRTSSASPAWAPLTNSSNG